MRLVRKLLSRVALPGATARNLLIIGICVTLLAAGGYWIWQRIGPRVLAQDDYLLRPEAIVVTAQPAWIRGDVKADVIRDGGLQGSLSILDDELGNHLASAFEFHPWVEKVERVTKTFPAHVDVTIRYRRPVAVVKLEGVSTLELLPVDATGTRLPSEDFSPLELRRYPRLSGITSLALVGQPPTDPRVIGGSQLADLLRDEWHAMGLALILPPEKTSDGFQLITRGGSAIVWGESPSRAATGEPSGAQKLAVLRQIVRDHGTLDSENGARPIDLRKATHHPRTARKPTPTASGR